MVGGHRDLGATGQRNAVPVDLPLKMIDVAKEIEIKTIDEALTVTIDRTLIMARKILVDLLQVVILATSTVDLRVDLRVDLLAWDTWAADT